ncbi:hypothetical protein [Brevibacterium linens]|uniref:Uncharacterized protein n=1 Tax=Brevibacterium linens TaxID=1703 RepID=A0A0B9AAF3_BRELN|nr:hypothetical protein [Brevibacterium linens]KHS52566.1 hypothetical protein AE0388_1549 [Brevibacterium linens]
MSDEPGYPDMHHQSRRWIKPVAISATVIGLLLVLATIFIEHSFWLSGVLVNFGTTLFLAAPLAWLGHYLSEQIKDSQHATESQISSVRDEVEDVQNDLDDLRETTSRTIAELQDNYSQSVAEKMSQRITNIQDLQSNPSLELLQRTMAEESRLKKISPDRFIIEYHAGHLYCRFVQDAWTSHGVTLQIFEYGSSSQDISASVNLSDATTLEEIFTRMNYDLATTNMLDPQDFDISRFFDQLTKSLIAVDECRKLHESIDLGPALIVPNDGWLITTNALVSCESRYPPLWFSRNYVPDVGLVKHLSEKPWVNYDEIQDATQWAWNLGLVSEAWCNGKLGKPDPSFDSLPGFPDN